MNAFGYILLALLSVFGIVMLSAIGYVFMRDFIKWCTGGRNSNKEAKSFLKTTIDINQKGSISLLGVYIGAHKLYAAGTPLSNYKVYGKESGNLFVRGYPIGKRLGTAQISFELDEQSRVKKMKFYKTCSRKELEVLYPVFTDFFSERFEEFHRDEFDEVVRIDYRNTLHRVSIHKQLGLMDPDTKSVNYEKNPLLIEITDVFDGAKSIEDARDIALSLYQHDEKAIKNQNIKHNLIVYGACLIVSIIIYVILLGNRYIISGGCVFDKWTNTATYIEDIIKSE